MVDTYVMHHKVHVTFTESEDIAESPRNIVKENGLVCLMLKTQQRVETHNRNEYRQGNTRVYSPAMSKYNNHQEDGAFLLREEDVPADN